MWIDTRDCEPLVDGEFMVQMTSGSVQSLSFTPDGGWNTHYDCNGVLHDDWAINPVAVARWFSVPTPEPVPEEWYKEWMYGKENNDGKDA